MPNNDPMYSALQINIPPELPEILKQFTKAAIRTQPKDLLQWSAAYFLALSKGERPPVKERLDFQLGQVSEKTLTKEAIIVLHRQLGHKPIVELSKVEEKWNALCLSDEDLKNILRVGSFAEEFEWLKFLALSCSHVSKSITEALTLICEVITKDLEGGRARIEFETFKYLYKYLAVIDGDIPLSHVTKVLEHLDFDVKQQSGMIAPRNFTSSSCPLLYTEKP
ncbi:ropporin-1-like protein [Hydra vulgaris]|uniref:Ropporin-1-like protein n=1 Tax=Hydra vulgaris TaxID=6087 RepID=A0ABM4C4L4_HYDVU|nr:ropporin-1-like protein [Hydra vulgaris]